MTDGYDHDGKVSMADTAITRLDEIAEQWSPTEQGDHVNASLVLEVEELRDQLADELKTVNRGEDADRLTHALKLADEKLKDMREQLGSTPDGSSRP